MASAEFSLQDSLGKVLFFEETFLLTDTNMKAILRMPFLSLSNAYFQFNTRVFNWRSYLTAEMLHTAQRVKLIEKHEFTRIALDENSKTFVIYVVVLNNLKLAIHPSQAPLLAAP